MELRINKETAKKLYPDVPEWFRQDLVKEFGKKTFQKRHFTDIKTLEDACEELDIPTPYFNGTETRDEFVYRALKIVVKAINQGWTPDWNNTDQRKWSPWFNLSSGFGFSYSYYSYDYTDATVGSRLCFESEEKSNYSAKQFIEMYKEFLTITK